MNTASLLAISDTTSAIRAGGAITEASSPEWASLSLDFANPALLSHWMSQADCKLLLSNRRLIALGFAPQLGDADQENASLIAIPPDADVNVLLTLVQANPKAIGHRSQLVNASNGGAKPTQLLEAGRPSGRAGPPANISMSRLPMDHRFLWPPITRL